MSAPIPPATPRDRRQAWLTTLAYSMTNEGAELSDKDCAELHALLAASETRDTGAIGETPRTDAQVFKIWDDNLGMHTEAVTANSSRQLERELATCRAVTALCCEKKPIAPSATEGPTEIWIVVGETGEYSGRNDWIVDAWPTKEAAQAKVEALKKRYLETGIERLRDDYYSEARTKALEAMLELDAGFCCDYTGTDWYIEKAELKS